MSFQFKLPDRTVIGENALESCESFIKSFGKKALIVTGRNVGKTTAFWSLTGLLSKWRTKYEVFDGITGEPTDVMIIAGVKVFSDKGCDFLIALGGGSQLDGAKAISAMTVLKGKLSDYAGSNIEGTFPQTVLIPTTAGTGSEATKFTVITDTSTDIKMLLKGDSLLPALAVVDPLYTITSPENVTAATGMDALTHAVEAYTSRKANSLTDPYALDAVKRIFGNLPEAYKNGCNMEARREMAIAAYEAGICINNSSVTIVHGMSRPIGALFHVPHGISNAILIKACLQYVRSGCPERFADLARAAGAAEAGTDDEEASGAFIGALSDLCGKLEIPTLEKYGIDREKFCALSGKMANDAMASGSPSNTVMKITRDDILKIYSLLWN